ncbi:solute carrier family 35 member G1-like [Strongylocentrotus purpuratus]|uniref:EamA domain-containing protein n=1 Tax=Strongylocentrotus purpuratus TaxID=7668 RepID=A0A7M7GLR3_STRPU|nr:solute carrier family 35 member G1-like [Strongylocentrotus purpuratus]|eukprot:XP_003727976.1 PREDICTED: solute carrier family 35 member G1-like [Strongylocentrotus purpuratus]
MERHERAMLDEVVLNDLMLNGRHLKDGVRIRPHAGLTRFEDQKENDRDTLSSDTPSGEYYDGQPKTGMWTRVGKVVVQRRGICWALSFAILTSFVSLTIKLLSGRVSPNQIVLYRSFTLVLFTGPNLIRHKVSCCLPLKAWGLIIVRGMVGTSYAICASNSLQQLDISTVTCIIQSSTFITCIFACLCLKETCSIPITVSCCISVVGVLLVVQPAPIFGGLLGSGSGENNLFGLLSAFSTALLWSLSFLLLRLLGRLKVHVQLLTFSYGCVSFLGCASLMSALDEWSIPRCGYDRLLVLVICIIGYLQIVTFTLALQMENAAVVAVISTTGVFVTFVLDFAFFDVTPNLLKVIGALCVTASSVGATISSYYAAKRKLSESKK